MRKRDELIRTDSCFSQAADDEPVFVLRAKDPLAPQTVRLWATMARSGLHEEPKINEALQWALDAEEYYKQFYKSIREVK